eukprot:4792374-Prymnesium_polylepis.1
MAQPPEQPTHPSHEDGATVEAEAVAMSRAAGGFERRAVGAPLRTGRLATSDARAAVHAPALLSTINPSAHLAPAPGLSVSLPPENSPGSRLSSLPPPRSGPRGSSLSSRVRGQLAKLSPKALARRGPRSHPHPPFVLWRGPTRRPHGRHAPALRAPRSPSRHEGDSRALLVAPEEPLELTVALGLILQESRLTPAREGGAFARLGAARELRPSKETLQRPSRSAVTNEARQISARGALADALVDFTMVEEARLARRDAERSRDRTVATVIVLDANAAAMQSALPFVLFV